MCLFFSWCFLNATRGEGLAACSLLLLRRLKTKRLRGGGTALGILGVALWRRNLCVPGLCPKDLQLGSPTHFIPNKIPPTDAGQTPWEHETVPQTSSSFWRLSLRSLKGRPWWYDIFASFYLCSGEVSDPRMRGLSPFDPLPPKQKLLSRAADFLKQEKVVSFSKIFLRSSFLSFPGFNLPPASLPYPTAESFPLSNSFATNKNSFRVFICKTFTS